MMISIHRKSRGDALGDQMFKIRFLLLSLVCCALAGAQDSGQTSNQPKPRPRMIRISSSVLPGFVEHVEQPMYPEESLKSETQGSVILKVDLDESGRVVLSTPVEGEPLLVAASIEALRGFRFRPYLLGGTPISVESQVGFRFSIQGHGGNETGKVEYVSAIPFREEFRTGAVTDKGVLVLQPRKLSGAEPQLPPDLAGKTGSVYLTIMIGTDGKVEDVKVTGGDEPFINFVVAAVKQFVYEPRSVDGKPTESTTQASYHFGTQR
jgi:outer membrane biosynthesis protein TonB